MSVYTTAELLASTQHHFKFDPLFLRLFFRETYPFTTEKVYLSQIPGLVNMALYVSPIVSGEVIRSRGGSTSEFTPGYVKPKHEVNPQMTLRRLPDEDPQNLADPAYRRRRIIRQNMLDENLAIAQVEEMQAVSAVLKGKYTMTGEAFDPVEVDMGRSAANNITQSGGTEWSKRDKSTYDPTDDIEAYALNASGVVNIIVFDPKGWALFRSFKAVREKLDTRRGSHSELETAVKDLGKAVSYKGMYGDVAIVVYSGQYVENGVKKNFLPDNTMVLGNTQARGLRTYGCIQDADAQREGINASARYPKNWVTHPRYGMGKRLGAADVDKWALYVIGQYCDQSVPDGFGGTEPRITCNAYLTTQRKAWDVLSDFCSAMRCMPVWNGQTLTFVQDRQSDKVWTYNRSNVVMPDDGAPFRYSFSALKDRHNAVEVNWIDPNNGWETATELVEDTQAIARYGRNVTKMDAFGCTSRGQAHRAGLWLIKTELLETQTVDFSVGAEGLRHVPGDVIEICDDDYAGISTGGRVLAVNSQTRTLTLDREITLPSSGTTLISLVDGSGNPVSVEVQSVTDGVKVKVSRVPDGVAEYSVWGLKLPTLRQRLFRCVSIRENDDGTYAITAVQHVPEKEAIVDNGAHFDGEQSGTVNGVTPPAVQHLTAEVTADSGEYQVLARWDTPKVVKGVSFLLRLTVAADDGSERLVSTARTTETTYRFTQLAPGNYRLTVRAANAWGQQGDPASVSFRIAAPAAPSRIELTPGYFQITATPHLAVYDPTVQFEFWFSEKRIADIRQVETTARYLGTALYWIAASINIKPGHDYYFYIRSVNTVGKSAFVEAVGQPSDDASGYLDFFKGEIGKSHLAQELWTQIDNGQLAPDLAEIRTSITDVSNEITQTVNKKLEDQSAAIQQIQKVQVDTNNNLNSMWAVKLQQMQDGRLYIAGIGAGIENTPDGMQSQVLLAADRIAMVNPANGNTKPMFVGQGDQIFMNEVFLKYLTAPTITSGGNPPAFSLTPDGRLTAKNADISGSVNANSGTLNNVTINENCRVLGKLSANQIEGDLVKTVGKAFPRDSRAPERWPSGTITVRVYDDQPFDRQIVIPAVAFSGARHERENSDTYSSCRLIVKKNGAEIYNRTALDNTLIYTGVIDMPAGSGVMTLEFSVSAWWVNGWYPTASISDLLVVVMKKATAGITIS